MALHAKLHDVGAQKGMMVATAGFQREDCNMRKRPRNSDSCVS